MKSKPRNDTLISIVAIASVSLALGLAVMQSPAVAQPVPTVTEDAPTPEALIQSLGGPTLVTLQGNDISLQTAVRALLAAANLSSDNAIGAKDATRTVTVNWQNTPFWKAASDLEQQTGLRWTLRSPVNSIEDLQLAPFRNSSSQVGVEGLDAGGNLLAMVVAKKVTRESTHYLSLNTYAVPPPNRHNNDTVGLQIAAYFDPKVRLLLHSPTAFTTIRGEEVKKGYVSFASELDGPNPLLYPVAFDFYFKSLPTDHQLSHVTGHLEAYAITRTDQWEVPNVITAHATAHQAAGGTFTIEAVKLNGESLTVSVSLVLPASSPLAASNGTYDIQLLDGQGEVVSHEQVSATLERSQKEIKRTSNFLYSLHISSRDFPDGEVRPGPFKLVWKIPAELKRVEVPFQLGNVPIP